MRRGGMRLAILLSVLCVLTGRSWAEEKTSVDTTRGDRMLQAYFRTETAKISDISLKDIKTAEDWKAHRELFHAQLQEMLGLDPLPEKTPLEAVVTGTVQHEEFTVEKVQFQSRPGLYVTGNLYLPKNLDKPAPTILYVCGHGKVKKNGISYGNKTHYQHHGAWFARNGYVCLMIDTLQLGEIEGLHHGTHNKGMWWWNARGYTPAGVEAWNCVRAIDYLQTRKEVDPERIGATGRSGGGAYTWWISALDERIKVAVPVAGITDLENHVVDGVIEGHCDCMFMVNTYRWDYAQVAALVAPRPLLISNTDKDRIFPLDGVVRLHEQVRNIYDLLGAGDKLGLQIVEGPHADTQVLRIHAFQWFDRFLKGDTPLIETAATKFFTPEQLRVFEENPTDEKNTTIHETFTQTADLPESITTDSQWTAARDGWLTALREKSFRAWPQEETADAKSLDLKPAFSVARDGVHFSAYDFTSQENVELRLYVTYREGLKPSELDLVVMNVLDESGWKDFLAMMRPQFAEQLAGEQLPAGDEKAFAEQRDMFKSFKWGMAYIAPRGVGPTIWNQNKKKNTHIRRRFMLLGQTIDGMRVWDVRRAAQALEAIKGFQDVPLWLQAHGPSAGLALYASLFEPAVKRLDLYNLPTSHHDGPTFLNVLRYLDVPQAVTMAAENTQVRIYDGEAAHWQFAADTAKNLGWDEKQLQIRKPPQK